MSQELEAKLNTLQQTPLTDEERSKFNTAAAEHLNKEETKNELLDEAKKLVGAAAAVDASFRHVQITLNEVDVELDGVKTSSGVPFKKYAPGWTELRDRWTSLFWKARDNATHIQAFISEFRYILDKVTEMSREKNKTRREELFEDNKQGLQDFLDDNDPEKKNGSVAKKVATAQDLSQDFKKLSEDVQSFGTEMTLVLKKEKKKENEESERLDGEIKALDQEIEKCSGFLYEIGKFLAQIPGTEIMGAIGDGLSCLAAFGPKSVLDTVAHGFKALFGAKDDFVTKNVQNVDDMIVDRDRKKARMKEIAGQIEVIERVQGQLASHDNDFALIVSRLMQFSKFWVMIWASAKESLNLLEKASATEKISTLKMDIDLSQKIMVLLAEALKEYITQANGVKFE